MSDRPSPDEVHLPWTIPDVVWASLKAEAAQKDALSEKAEWTRELRPDFNFVGLLGEHFYSFLSGLPRKTGFGDGGEDFPGIDVKTVAYYYDPILKVNEIRTSYYALVAVALESRLIRYCGYADRAMIERAPTSTFGKNSAAHALHEATLIRGLCPAPAPEAT